MKEGALNQISDLVERFERNIEAYRNPAYNETQLRIEFIDPFFKALGWDVDATDQQIDNLVYELYGLTEKEIQIVEEGTNENGRKQERSSPPGEHKP